MLQKITQDLLDVRDELKNAHEPGVASFYDPSEDFEAIYQAITDEIQKTPLQKAAARTCLANARANVEIAAEYFIRGDLGLLARCDEAIKFLERVR